MPILVLTREALLRSLYSWTKKKISWIPFMRQMKEDPLLVAKNALIAMRDKYKKKRSNTGHYRSGNYRLW